MRACMTTYNFAETKVQLGHDNLLVYESGHEQSPFVNLYNERPSGVPHAGGYSRKFSKKVAVRPVDDLAAI